MSSQPKRPAAAGPPIAVTAHPPERKRRPTSVTLPSGCCCCCCCCLHTIGGLVGGLAGTLGRIDRPPRPVDPSFPFPFRRDELDEDDTTFPPGVVYWLMVSLLIAVTSVWVYFAEGGKKPESLFYGLVVALFILPALQLGASVLSVIAVALLYADRGPALARIGKITLWSFVGTMIGIGVMGACLGPMFFR